MSGERGRWNLTVKQAALEARAGVPSNSYRQIRPGQPDGDRLASPTLTQALRRPLPGSRAASWAP